jgi:hypothetical protein
MSKRVFAISGLAIAALIAACGGGGAPQLSPGGPLTSLPAIPSLPADPGVGVPSFQPDADLEALFPDSVGGRALNIESARGEDVIPAFGSDEPDRLRNFFTNLGASMDQVSAAISFNIFPGATEMEFTGLTLIALRVQGVPASNTLAGLTEVTKEDVENAQVGTATVGGKPVTAITNPENPDENVYLYGVGDVVFFGGGTPQYVEEAFAQLP